MGASAAAIFLLGMLTAQMTGPLDPAAPQTKAGTISPEEIAKRMTGRKDKTALDAI
jgi:hypothetical protein